MKLRSLVWVCFALLPAHVFAQGTISGVATDAGQDVLPGVVVELAAPDGQELRTTVTDAAGRFEFRNVGPGTYSVTFRLPGFNTLRREGVSLAPGQSAATVDAVVLRVALPETPQLPRRPPSRPDADSRECLHGAGETASERQRREDALAAMRMIDEVIARRPPRTRVPTWEQLAASPVVASLRGMRGQVGELARRIAWGDPEPLPGWGIAYVPTATEVRFALTDLRDACAFTYTSQDPMVLPRGFRVLPVSE